MPDYYGFPYQCKGDLIFLLPSESLWTGSRIIEAIPPERGMSFPDRGSLYFPPLLELVDRARLRIVTPLLMFLPVSVVLIKLSRVYLPMEAHQNCIHIRARDRRFNTRFFIG